MLSKRVGLRTIGSICGKAKLCHPLKNPGFETGDFTGWNIEISGPYVTEEDKHSGRFSACFYGYPTGGAISQDVTPAIPKSQIKSLSRRFSGCSANTDLSGVTFIVVAEGY